MLFEKKFVLNVAPHPEGTPTTAKLTTPEPSTGSPAVVKVSVEVFVNDAPTGTVKRSGSADIVMVCAKAVLAARAIVKAAKALRPAQEEHSAAMRLVWFV